MGQFLGLGHADDARLGLALFNRQLVFFALVCIIHFDHEPLFVLRRVRGQRTKLQLLEFIEQFLVVGELRGRKARKGRGKKEEVRNG